MPHNKTRFWVGVAILAITIPAVGQYVLGSRNDSQRQLATDSARWSAGGAYTTGRRLSPGQQTPPRDYAAEVAASTSRRGLVNEYDAPEYYDSLVPYDEYDDSFTDEPLEPETAVTRDVPDGSDELAPTEVATTDGTTPVDDDDDQPVVEALVEQGPTDREVYQAMLASVEGQDRADFVRAWAIMTPAQREEALDGYRASNY